MDDFGSSLERDYGLGRRKHKFGISTGRSSSRGKNSSSSNNHTSSSYFDNNLRFSESFGRTNRGNFSAAGGGYGHGSSSSSYNVYDEVFSCNGQSTIPVFEDVFRVPSSRMKVSELRDNDIFRGIPSSSFVTSAAASLKKISGSSRVTYEDIFGETADELSGPFVFSDAAGSKAAAAASSSQAGSSGRLSPHAAAGNSHHARKDATELWSPASRKDSASGGSSKESPIAHRPRNENHHKIQTQTPREGSFLSMPFKSKEEENGGPTTHTESRSAQDENLIVESKANGDNPAGKEAAAISPAYGRELIDSKAAWLSVADVSLSTKPSETPPARSAPGRASSSKNSTEALETAQVDSGPPPLRIPPSIDHSDDHIPNAEEVPSSFSGSSELLERVLKERNAYAELSIRDKVLDWQKHNLSQQQAEEGKQKKRSETLNKLQAERDEIERIAAEVEEAAARQSKMRAERAASEHLQRDARANMLKQPEQQQQQQDGGSLIKAGKEELRSSNGMDNAEVGSSNGPETATVVHVTEAKAEASEIKTTEEESTLAVKTENQRLSDAENASSSISHSIDDIQPSSRNSAAEVLASKVVSDCEAKISIDTISSAVSEEATSSRTSRAEAPEEAKEAAEEEKSVNLAKQLQTEKVSSDNESTISIDTISSAAASEDQTSSTPGSRAAAHQTAGAKEEEAAPETPERLEKLLHPAKKSSGRISEIEVLESAWEEEEEQQQQQTKTGSSSASLLQQDDEKRRREERSLVARITAEVKERAAEKAAAEVRRSDRRSKVPRLKADHRNHMDASKPRSGGGNRVSLREQLEKERLARMNSGNDQQQPVAAAAHAAAPAAAASADQIADHQAAAAAKLVRAERSLVERINAEVRDRAAASAKAEHEREKERLQRIDKAREKERERLEKLERERERERERLEREMEREREIEREKDRVHGLQEKAAKERADAEAAEAAAANVARMKLERAAVERATAEARARAERAAYERVAYESAAAARPSSVPKQRFGNSVSMPTQQAAAADSGMRRTTSSTNLDSDRYSSSSNSREFHQEFKGETPERRKARLERYQRTLNRAAQALAQKNKRDLELQTEQAERQRLSERLDSEIKRWSVGKDGNIRALLSTLQYVLWPESGWKQVTLTELINPAAVKKAYRRATLCVHPDKMQQKHATVQQKYIAEKVFHILQVAWNKFNCQEAL